MAPPMAPDPHGPQPREKERSLRWPESDTMQSDPRLAGRSVMAGVTAAGQPGAMIRCAAGME